MKQYDTIIVGSGAAGLTAALYLLRAGYNIALVEVLAPGGQILNTERIDNYPGFPEGLLGYELADKFNEHLKNFKYDKYMDAVTEILLEGNAKIIKVGKEEISAKTVILCTGTKWMTTGASGEKELVGKGVSYCALCDANFFRDQEVICVGGGNTALEESLYLSKIVKKVHLIHRRDKFRGERIYQKKVSENPKIVINFDTVVEKFKSDKTGLIGVDLRNVKTNLVRFLEISGAFIFVGHIGRSDFLPDFMKNERGFIQTDTEMNTKIAGVFAAGDVRQKLCRQVVTAAGDGATAAYSAIAYLESYE